VSKEDEAKNEERALRVFRLFTWPRGFGFLLLLFSLLNWDDIDDVISAWCRMKVREFNAAHLTEAK